MSSKEQQAAAGCSEKKSLAELHKLVQATCSIDLADSRWIQELPRLPVPDVWLTVSRYLASLKAVLAPTLDASKPSGDQQADEPLPPPPPQRLADEKDPTGSDAALGTGRAAGASEQWVPLGCALTSAELERRQRQYERTDQLVRRFMLNEGPQLQRDLKEYANKCQNWATDYWLQDMYLSNSAPLPVNSNPFFLFPRQRFSTTSEMLMFATRIIQFSVDFKYRIDQQTLRQDYGSGHGKGKPLCMETYKNFFHSYRMPHDNMDRLLPQSRRSNHIVVASCDQFFVLRLGKDPLDNPYRKDAASQLEEASIYEQLLCIYRVSRENAKRSVAQDNGTNDNGGRKKVAKIGLLTSENRKTWAKLHKRLIHCDAGETSNFAAVTNTNIQSLNQIEDCLFVLCLDSLVSNNSNNNIGNQSGNRDDSSAGGYDNLTKRGIDDIEYAAKVILHGAGTKRFTANRWFDKFLQIIVGRDGICGINIEHSASEGITVLRFLVEFLSFIQANPIIVHDTNNDNGIHDFSSDNINTVIATAHDSISSSNYVEPESPSALLSASDKIIPLSWTLDEQLLEAIDLAEERANKLVDDFSLKILNFTYFGRAFIKNQNLSPDAFVQLALQYTFYKLHGQLVSTYESASLRQFRFGRVDNIRANTCEAFNWIQSMLKCRQRAEKTSLLGEETIGNINWKPAESSFIKAITKQVEILRYTIVGGAPDNHLLALKELAKLRFGPDDLPKIFTDESYKEFNNFRLSTSQLPNDADIYVGYGAVVPDGYGCSYNPCENKIVFCISSFHDCPETDSKKFASKLVESLLEMRQLCLVRRSVDDDNQGH